MAASGGEAGGVGFNGTVVLNLIQNKTIAQIDSGAVIDIGLGSITVNANDDSMIVSLEGGVAMSDNVGIGASVGVNVVLRDTQAVIGDLLGDTPTLDSDKGSVTSAGDILIDAENSGFIVTLSVAGGVADGSSKAQKQSESEGGSSEKGFFATVASQFSDEGKKITDFITKLKTKKEDIEEPFKGITGFSTPKSGIAISGSVAVNVIDDDALAYVLNSGAITVSDGGLYLDARNSTSIGSLAGAVAYGKTSGSEKSAGIAGAFGVNVLMGDTKAFVDGATSLTLDELDIEASRTGWTVSLDAGFGIAVGEKAVGVGASVGANIIMYTVEALLQDTTGVVDGPVKLNAEDDTKLINIAGAGGFGSKAGVGIGFGFTYTGNTVLAQMSNVTDFKHTGELDVLATVDDLIVSVSGSVGVAKGSNYSGGGYAGAGTISVNYVHNTIDANILNTTTTTDSTGDITLLAQDETSVYSFSGAFAYGKNLGFAGALALNVLDNEIGSAIEGSTLYTTGSFSETAGETGTVVSLAVGGAGSKKTAIAASVGANLFINEIDAHISDNSLVKAGGPVLVKAEDMEISVGLAGGIAVSSGQAAVGAAIGLNLL